MPTTVIDPQDAAKLQAYTDALASLQTALAQTQPLVADLIALFRSATTNADLFEKSIKLMPLDLQAVAQAVLDVHKAQQTMQGGPAPGTPPPAPGTPPGAVAGPTAETTFPAPDTRDVGKILAYGDALVKLQNAIAKAKIGDDELQAMFAKAAASPADFAKAIASLPPELQKVAKAILDLSRASKSTADMGKAAQGAIGIFQALGATIARVGAIGGSVWGQGTSMLRNFVGQADERGFDNLETAILRISLHLGRVFAPVVAEVTQVLNKLADRIASMSPAQMDQIAHWTKITLGIAGAAMALSRLLSILQTGMGVLSGFSNALGMLGIATPLGWIITLIAAVAGLSAVLGSGEEPLAGWGELWEKLSDVAGKLWANLQPVIEGLLALVVDILGPIVDFVANLIDGWSVWTTVILGMAIAVPKLIAGFMALKAAALAAAAGIATLTAASMVSGLMAIVGVIALIATAFSGASDSAGQLANQMQQLEDLTERLAAGGNVTRRELRNVNVVSAEQQGQIAAAGRAAAQQAQQQGRSPREQAAARELGERQRAGELAQQERQAQQGRMTPEEVQERITFMQRQVERNPAAAGGGIRPFAEGGAMAAQMGFSPQIVRQVAETMRQGGTGDTDQARVANLNERLATVMRSEQTRNEANVAALQARAEGRVAGPQGQHDTTQRNRGAEFSSAADLWKKMMQKAEMTPAERAQMESRDFLRDIRDRMPGQAGQPAPAPNRPPD